MKNRFSKKQGKNLSLNKNKISEEDVDIHIMPKIFSSLSIVKKPNNSSKTVGLLILVGGVFVLIGVLGLFYYFLTRGDTVVVNEPIVKKVAQEDTDADTKKDDKKDEDNKEEEQTSKNTTNNASGSNSNNEPEKNEDKDENPKLLEATSTPEVKEPATKKEKATSTEEAEKATSTVVEIEEKKVVIDTDGDGLSDIEEVVLGINSNLADSDGDTYGDLMEVLGLYNPAGQGNILVNSNIERYINNKYKYSIYYSSFWPIELAGGEESVMFKLNNNQFINIIVEENEETLSIEDWYKKQFNNAIIKPGQKVTKKGWTGLKSKDNLIAYLMHPARKQVFVLSYNLGLENTESYKTIFKMMIESLQLEE